MISDDFASDRKGREDVWILDPGPGSVSDGGASRGPGRSPIASPNMFSRGTTNRFDLQGQATCTATIHDVKGRVIRSLATERYTNGGPQYLYRDGFDDRGGRVSSGKYFCEVRTPGIRGVTGIL